MGARMAAFEEQMARIDGAPALVGSKHIKAVFARELFVDGLWKETEGIAIAVGSSV
jgi:hypothetical protein